MKGKRRSSRVTLSESLTHLLQSELPHLHIKAVVRRDKSFAITVKENRAPWTTIRRLVARWYRAAFGMRVRFGKVNYSEPLSRTAST